MSQMIDLQPPLNTKHPHFINTHLDFQEWDEEPEWDDSIDAAEPIKNELKVQHLGMLAMNAFSRYNSASRGVMFGTQFSQCYAIDNANEKRQVTGIEQEMSKYTFDVRMPADGRVYCTLDRYPTGGIGDSFDYNPESFVVFEEEHTGIYDILSIPKHLSLHPIFGYKYVEKPGLSQVSAGAHIKKDTIFASPACVRENGGLATGISVNCCYASFPAGSEDGFIISESLQNKSTYRVLEKRRFGVGKEVFPRNLYGDLDNYKPIPDIGGYVREDGLVAALAEYNTMMSPAMMSIYDAREVDIDFDRCIYARPGRGRVVDVKVIANHDTSRRLPEAMSAMLNKYATAYRRFCEQLIQIEKNLRQEYRAKTGSDKLPLSGRFRRMLVEARAIVNYNATKFQRGDKAGGNAPVLSLQHRKNTINEYEIEITIEYVVRPELGNKYADSHGGKGVLVGIWSDHMMPVDENGNVAHVIADSGSGSHRMIYGRFYEHFLSSAQRDVTKRICHILDIVPPAMANDLNEKPRTWIDKDYIARIDQKKVSRAWKYLMSFYSEVSRKQFKFFKKNSHYRNAHLAYICQSGIYLNIPVDSMRQMPTIVRRVQRRFKPTYGPVYFKRDENSPYELTHGKIRIAEIYLYLLDKTPEDGFSSVAFGRLGHFGLLAPITKTEKFSRPVKQSASKTHGETEARSCAAYAGDEAVAEIFDRANTPSTQLAIARAVADAPYPTNIDKIVDRHEHPYGNLKTMQLLESMNAVAGMSITYVPEEANCVNTEALMKLKKVD